MEKVFSVETLPMREGALALVKVGEQHDLRNAGPGEMLILAMYDPPLRRS